MTRFSGMLTAACCLVVDLGLGLGLVSGWSAHVFILLSVVIFTLPLSASNDARIL